VKPLRSKMEVLSEFEVKQLEALGEPVEAFTGTLYRDQATAKLNDEKARLTSMVLSAMLRARNGS